MIVNCNAWLSTNLYQTYRYRIYLPVATATVWMPVCVDNGSRVRVILVTLLGITPAPAHRLPIAYRIHSPNLTKDYGLPVLATGYLPLLKT